MNRLYFDRNSIPVGTQSIRIYERYTQNGEASFIDEVAFNPSVDFVETNNANEGYYWFSLSVVNALGEESEKSDSILSDKIYEVIEIIRENLGDINPDSPAFSDDEYILKIREAKRRLSGKNLIDIVDEADISLLILLVRISCCYALAYDYARNSKITLPEGVSLDKGEIVKHYLDIAKALENQFAKIKEEWVNSDGTGITSNVPAGEVLTTTRVNYFSDTRVDRKVSGVTRRIF